MLKDRRTYEIMRRRRSASPPRWCSASIRGATRCNGAASRPRPYPRPGMSRPGLPGSDRARPTARRSSTTPDLTANRRARECRRGRPAASKERPKTATPPDFSSTPAEIGYGTGSKQNF
jgi:hypothetical protein